MKPILFNTDMVRAILDGRKTVTRRVVKPQPRAIYHDGKLYKERGKCFAVAEDDHGGLVRISLPYQPCDILYVREAWCQYYDGTYDYRAGHKFEKEGGWHPSIHMPKDAARIFLRVTKVFAQRIQDITDEQARAEGCKDRNDFTCVWNECYASPQPVKENGVIIRYESYPWENIQETRTYRDLPWLVIGNPWVRVIEFERISKEEAIKNGM